MEILKRPIGLWIFWILGIVSNIFLGKTFYPVLYMFTQLSLFLWIVFLLIAALFLPLLIISSIGLLRLKRWGRNIFFSITLIMNIPVIVLLTLVSFTSKASDLFIQDVILLLFIVLFMVYFLHPSVRKLFK